MDQLTGSGLPSEAKNNDRSNNETAVDIPRAKSDSMGVAQTTPVTPMVNTPSGNNLKTPSNGINNNWGKVLVVILYAIIVFLSPLVYVLPFYTTYNQSVQNLVPSSVDQTMKRYIYFLRNDDAQQAYTLMSPQARQQTLESSLQSIAPYFASTTSDIKIVNAAVNHLMQSSYNETTYDVAYELQTPGLTTPFMLAEIVAQDTSNNVQIVNVHITSEEQSISEQAQFNFSKQGVYFILALAVPAFITYTAIRYIIKAYRPKWSLLFIILLVSLYISLTSTNAGLTLGIYSFTSKTGPWGTWAYAIPVPLGAIYYYFVRKKHENQLKIF